jgi:hypothetical protein
MDSAANNQLSIQYQYVLYSVANMRREEQRKLQVNYDHLLSFFSLFILIPITHFVPMMIRMLVN